MLRELSEAEIDSLARSLIRAQALASSKGLRLCLEGDLEDLGVLQSIMDNPSQPLVEQQVEDLAYVFGSIFVANGPYDWARSVQDGYPEDTCVRVTGFALQFSPVGYVLKRWDDGARIDFAESFSDLRQRLSELVFEAAVSSDET